MATEYDLIYDRFLSNITDYELSALIDAELEENLLKYLKGAITDFKYCIVDLSDRDDTSSTFNIDLSENEQEILAKFMIVKWINPSILRLENLKNELGSKDFNSFSPSAFLDKLILLKQTLKDEAAEEMEFYYYAT